MIYTFNLLSPDEVRRVNEKYDEAAHWNKGKVWIVDSNVDKPSIKKNKVLDRHSKEYNYCVELLNKSMQTNTLFKSTYVMKDITQPLVTQYSEGDFYAKHVDSVNISGLRTDHSMTLFLSDPDEYEGGELILYHGDTEYKIKEPAGTVVIYNTGLVHEVKPVTSGNRRVILMWALSVFDDPMMREHVIDLGRGITDLLEWCEANPNIGYEEMQRVLVPIEQVRTNIMRTYGNIS